MTDSTPHHYQNESAPQGASDSNAGFGVARATPESQKIGWVFDLRELDAIRDEVDLQGWSTCAEQVQEVLLALERRGVVVTPNAVLTGAVQEPTGNGAPSHRLRLKT